MSPHLVRTPPASPVPGWGLNGDRAKVIHGLIHQFQNANFKRAVLKSQQDAFRDELATWGTGTDDLLALCEQVECWVRWWRLPGYWLASCTQALTQHIGSPVHPEACRLFSEAQASVSEGLAYLSMENAYLSAQRLLAAGAGGLKEYEEALKARLRRWHRHYYSWLHPASYMDLNPLLNHDYELFAEWNLRGAFPEQLASWPPKSPDALRTIIDACTDANTFYYRIVARRFLGLTLESTRNWDRAIEEYEAGIQEASQFRLETELGHLRRHCAHALREVGEYDRAVEHLEAALRHEDMPDFAYWYALSALELGDVRLAQVGTGGHQPGADRYRHEVDISKDRPKVERALKAYRAGRMRWESSLAMPAPVTRAVRQQMMRSFHDNSLSLMIQLASASDILAETEAGGPRQATEVVAEIRVSRESGASVSEFRKNRALFATDLSSIGGDFERYIEALPEHYQRRRAYMQAYMLLERPLGEAQLSDTTAEQILALRLPGVTLLLFDVGWNDGTATLFDAEHGRVLAAVKGPFGHTDLEPIYARYAGAVKGVEASSINREASFGVALERLLADCQEIFGPLLSFLLPATRDRRLVIFPRDRLHAIPFHALRIDDRYVAEHCTVSYCPTQGLFLRLLATASSASDGIKLLKVQSGADMRWYDAVTADSVPAEDRLDAVLDAVRETKPTDILFACHGNYDLNDAHKSKLWFGGPEGTSFWDLFSELDVTGCRSVILGACESGLTRNEATAEYIGLPAAFHSAGAPYVVGSLWKVNQLATVILVREYLQALSDASCTCPEALRRAQLVLMNMTRDDVAVWIEHRLATLTPTLRAALTKRVRAMTEQPYRAPQWWSGFYVSGA
jgi:tetratricopeptide (TPR) repeat protein